MEGAIKLVVTANPVLATLIHEARYIVCDYTFKQTNGDLNEWEVAVWRGATNERELLWFKSPWLQSVYSSIVTMVNF